MITYTYPLNKEYKSHYTFGVLSRRHPPALLALSCAAAGGPLAARHPARVVIFVLINKSMTQLIVFDLDGTLLNSMHGLADCAEIVIHQCYGLPRGEARAAYLHTSGIPFFAQLEELFPGDSRNADAHESFAALKRVSYFNWPLYDGVIGLLASLQAAGIRTAISSNSEETLVKKLVARKKLDVDCALGYRPGCIKGRGHFRFLTEVFGLAPAQMLFVGDSLWDARYARESGTPFIAKLGTLRADEFTREFPDVPLIRDVTEILARGALWKSSSWPRAAAAV